MSMKQKDGGRSRPLLKVVEPTPVDSSRAEEQAATIVLWLFRDAENRKHALRQGGERKRTPAHRLATSRLSASKDCWRALSLPVLRMSAAIQKVLAHGRRTARNF
jgi:hypothetical protein